MRYSKLTLVDTVQRRLVGLMLTLSNRNCGFVRHHFDLFLALLHRARSARTMQYLNNPSAVLDVTIDTTESGAKLYFSLVAVAQAIVGSEWAGSDEESVEVAALTGGITNVLYLLEHKTSGAKVIARLYGSGTSAFIDRDSENMVFAKLSELQFGPVFYGLFNNGRLEGFLPAVALQSHEMGAPDVAPGVAAAVAQLHAIDVPEIKKERWLWTKIETFMALAEG